MNKTQNHARLDKDASSPSPKSALQVNEEKINWHIDVTANYFIRRTYRKLLSVQVVKKNS